MRPNIVSLACMGYDEMNDARNIIVTLEHRLEKMHANDSDEEISTEFAVRPIDAALRHAAEHDGDHPVVSQIREMFSPESVVAGRSIRVGEVLPGTSMLSDILNRRVSEMALDQSGAVRRRPTTD